MSAYQPRPYQCDCIAALAEARENGVKKGLVVMASGLGKTLTAIFDLQQFLQEHPGARILCLCHQESILLQSKAKFRKFFGEEYSYGMFTGSYKTAHPVNFLFATFQTMRDHREEFSPDTFDYIVVDEAHHTAAETYQPTADYFVPQFLLGLTATKDRMDGQNILDTYEQVLYQMDIYDGWNEGWLARVDYRIMLDDLNEEEFKKYVGPHATGEKVSLAQLNKTIFAPQRDEGIIASIREQTVDLDNPSIFIFCSSIEHANAMAHQFGDEAAVIHSGQNIDLNEAILSSFRSGDIRVIVSVNMLNEGIDVPEADVVVFLRATESSTIFFQQLGRGLRISGEKRTVRVLDYVANISRIATILEMEDTAKQRIPASPTYSPSASKPDPLIVNIPAAKFKVERVDVERVMAKIRRKTHWTDQELIECLKRKASEVGHTPTCKEIDDDLSMPHSLTYLIRFGSMQKACELTSLTPRIPFRAKRAMANAMEKSHLIAALQLKAETLGHTPSRAECCQDSGMPSDYTYIRVFGSWNNAIKEAGLKVYEHIKPGTWTQDRIIAALQLKAQELGRKPTMHDVDKDKSMPATDTVKRVFGSWSNALEQAGFEPKRGRKHENQKLIRLLIAKASEMGVAPSQRAVNQDPDMPSSSVFKRHFGSWNAAIKAAGLIPYRQENN